MNKPFRFATIVLVAMATWTASLSAAPIFQIRAVLEAPTDQSEQMSIVTSSEGKVVRTEVVNVQKEVLFDQSALKSAEVKTAQGHPVIAITFTDDGRKRFAEVTRQHLGMRLAIIIEGRLYCAPKIMAEITGGKAEVVGQFSESEAKDLAEKIAKAIRTP